jgi:hypothetical protein
MALTSLLLLLLATNGLLAMLDESLETKDVTVAGNGVLSMSPMKDQPAEGIRIGAPLGVSNGYISSSQISSSSNFNADHDTRGVRLLRSVHPVSSWSAGHINVNQWVQVDFQESTRVTGVATQGRNAYNEWVTTYKILYSSDGVSWSTYKENGQDKIFIGNSDQNGVVKNDFSSPFQAQYVRLNPLSWFGHISLRLEFYGNQDVCKSGLGMVSGSLDSNRLSASSSVNDDHDERGSRLLTHSKGAHSLSTQVLDTHQYLQIDAGLVTTITAVATQGRNGVPQWITTYLLYYSIDGHIWFPYKEHGAVRTFPGNTDSSSVVTNKLEPTITARYVRINPQTWVGYISFRAELYGCPRECDFPLGMTTGEIDSYHVTTSSDINPDHDHRTARLLTDTPGGGWIPKYNDFQWVQVNFGGKRRVTGVALQGRLHHDQWVTAYYVCYSNDGQGWIAYRRESDNTPKLFEGNTDRDEVTKHTFHPVFVSKYARILPHSFVGHVSMRVEFYGCAI